jgi:hypothetical protein
MLGRKDYEKRRKGHGKNKKQIAKSELSCEGEHRGRYQIKYNQLA